jgi:hypothetical protein
MTFDAEARYEETMARARRRATTLDEAVEHLAGAEPTDARDADPTAHRRRILADVLAELGR